MTEINLTRFHDLSQRLAAFSTQGGLHLRGDTEDVQIDSKQAEVVLRDGERELARFGGTLSSQVRERRRRPIPRLR